MNRIFFIADHFFSDGVLGGAEKCNDVLISEFFNKNYNDYKDYMFIAINSRNFKPQIVKKNLKSIFFVANFMELSEESKKCMIRNKVDYVIIEYDHKYLKSNNPGIYNNFLSNEEGLQNLEFFKKARAVLCQSTLHGKIIYKNLLLDNLVNLKGNLWSENELSILQDTLDNSSDIENREIDWAVLNTSNKNKGIPSTINYCIKKGLEYKLIGSSDFADFTKQIAMSKGVAFFPHWVDTFNRFIVETRILNCKAMVNKKVGCASDGFLNLKGQELLDKVRKDKERIFQVYEDLILSKDVEKFSIKLPRISIITTFVKAEIYLKDFLDSVVAQTIFKEVDLIVYDAGSSGREQQIMKEYCDKYSNIFHIRDENKIGSSKAFNRLMDMSKNDFISMISIDDRPAPDYADKMRKYLLFSNADLVYGDCVQTYEENDKIDENFYNSDNLYEHSLNDFSPENMIKSLPGPMPMFRKAMIIKNGGFDENYKHCNDWELWLRCVRGGSKFYKIHRRLGLYYFNPNGVTTSAEKFSSKIKEEARVFHEFKDVLGEENFNRFKDYFSQGL